MIENPSTLLLNWLTKLENRHVQEIQLGLTRVHAVASLLNVLELQSTIITVGGTNGKGSTVALLESIYLAAGYKVGSYTSPHLITFNERIKTNSMPINDEELIKVFEIIDDIRGDIPLTYFETVTLAALYYFKQCSLDLIILEVGLGGRLDATNIIDSDLTIITTIDKDHEEYLGHTLEAIGYEKAGIMREKKPCVFADKLCPQSIIDYSNQLKNTLIINGRDYFYTQQEDTLNITFQNQQLTIIKPNFHTNSVVASLIAVELLQDSLPVPKAYYQLGLDNAILAGRIQWLKTSIPTLIDVAHNAQSARYLADYIESNPPSGKIHAVFSALTDKNIIEIIKPLTTQIDKWYLALLPGKRAASKEQLITALAANGVHEKLCYNDPVHAYQAACKNSLPGDFVMVYGSFLTVSSILSSCEDFNLAKETG